MDLQTILVRNNERFTTALVWLGAEMMLGVRGRDRGCGGQPGRGGGGGRGTAYP
jgi:hypothetical protein